MKYSCDIKGVCQSCGGVLAITVLLILVIFAIFTSSGPGKSLSGNAAKVDWEDVQEQRNANNERHFVIKNGKKLVVF